jgi:hypothetical protein
MPTILGEQYQFDFGYDRDKDDGKGLWSKETAN